MAKNIKSMRKLYDYSELMNEEALDNDLVEIVKKNKAKETSKEKMSQVLKVGQGFLENFKIILDTREDNHRNLFILMIFILWIEYILNGLIDIFLARLGINLMFSVPLLVIILENERFYKFSSIFEMNYLISLKIFLVINKELNYFQLLATTLLLNMFNSVFMKRLYIYVETFGDEIKDIKTRRKTTLRREFRFMLFGMICNYLWMIYIYNKLKFTVLDETISIMFSEQMISSKYLYLTIMMYFSSRRVFQYFSSTEKHSIGSAFLIATHFILGKMIDESSFSTLVTTFLFFILLKVLFNKLRVFSFTVMTIYILHSLITQSLISTENTEIEDIKIILFFTNIGLIVSILFVIIIFSKSEFIKIYNKINERIFFFKLGFDLSLYISFIYIFVNHDKQNYLTHFNNLKHIFLFILFIQYILTFAFLHFRLNVQCKMTDVEQFLIFEKDENYNINSSYYEVKIYKNLKYLIDFISEDIDVFTKKSLKNIKTILLVIIFFLALFLFDDSKYFFIFYLIFLQFFGPKILKNQLLNLIYKLLEDKFQGKIKPDRLKSKELKIKIKLIYLMVFPYLVYIWKLFIIRTMSYLFFENYICVQRVIYGEIEPITNILYTSFISNSRSFVISYTEIIIILVFLLPNSLYILYSHITNDYPTLIVQNICILNIIPFFFSYNFDAILISILNLFVLVTIFASDEETYTNFFYWFDFIGVYPYSKRKYLK